MSMIMDLLKSLGINGTAIDLFGIFLVAFVFIYFILMAPYFRAFKERVNRTLGHAEIAEKFLAESRALHDEYDIKAKAMNAQFKAIYDSNRTEAMREYDKVVNDARLAAKAEIERSRQAAADSLAQARRQMEKEIPSLAETITGRLIGKDLSQ
jgi:F0F1-type ATP synthase membrane subunit b/b'